ncbi:MAG: zf-TFIIB domain-containing protein [Fimbriimonadaceae bacterium]|nr:zf-TFIIB domain-containing protein [Fimbriimonadaceae bacterium]NUM37959.1 zf-TFIIB domain-containing protein [Armatimonadota bacterium]
MLCPKCHDQVLVVIDREGIEVDYCGGCRGVWLDRGELDKLIARAATADAAQAATSRRSARGRYDEDHEAEQDDDNLRGRRGRRGGFLGDLFDFD